MKVVYTRAQAYAECRKMLKKKDRYNKELDDTLFEEAYINITQGHAVFAKGIMIHTEEIKMHEIDCKFMIIYNPFVVYLSGCAYAVCFTDTINQIVVFVDDDYFKLSENAKTFTKYHELGHIYHKHQITIGSRFLAFEYEADNYASQYCNGVDALLELKHTIKRKDPRIELHRRIRELKNPTYI